jgi:hypothetical protein
VEPKDRPRFIKFGRVAEVLSFRWSVTGGNAQELESTYQKAAATVHTSKGAKIDEAERDLIDAIPDNAEFRKSLEAASLGYQYVAAYALRKIERALAPGEKKIGAPTDVHLEHIMPQTSTKFWESRNEPDTSYTATVAKWGNLTLLLKKLNTAIKNGDWDTKRNGNGKFHGYNKSDVKMTHDLLKVDEWNWEEIALRGKWLSVLGERVWDFDRSIDDCPQDFSDVAKDPSLLDPFIA